MRQVTLVAGATTPAVSTVLAVFMGGLALGARLFGGLADRCRSPLKLYAGLELGIGLYGLLQPELTAVVGSAYAGLVRQTALQGPLLLGTRLAMAAAILLVPCLLMGGTLPVLARFLGRNHERFGLELGTLYAINLAGAVVGSLLTGFMLVRELGLHGTLAAGALGNLLVGLAALLAAPGAEARRAAAPREAQHTRRPLPAGLHAMLLALAGISGFATMAYQVTWTRVLSFGFDSTVYAFTAILVTFLLGLSLGSLVFARLDRRASHLKLLMAAHVLGGLTALLLTPLAARQPELVAMLTSRFGLTGTVQLAGMGLGAAAVMLLPTTLMGIVFPLVSRLLVEDVAQVGRQLGRAYGINTLGAILGSLLTGLILIPAWSLKGCLLALSLGQILAGLLLLPWCGLARRAQAGLALAGGAALVLAGWAFTGLLRGPNPFDQVALAQTTGARFVAHRDDVAASVSVVETVGHHRALRINGFEAATEDPGAGYMQMMSHLPLLLHPQPRRVLVICFGTGSTAGAVLSHPGAQVDVVDINRSVFELAPWFERANQAVFRSPRARLIVDDGRNYLVSTGERYDVVTSEPMPPTHAGVVNLYSREYYLTARERLAPGGLLVQWLPFHLLEFQETLDILRTVQSVFPETTLWVHSLTGLIVARADGPVRIGWPRLEAAWREPELGRGLARLGLAGPEAFAQTYMLGPRGVAVLAEAGHTVLDDRPTLEFHPPRHRLRERIGPYTLDSARALAAVYELRASERPPLDGTDLSLAQRLNAAFVDESLLLQADLQLRIGQAESARQLCLKGLQTGGPRRPLFLFGLALVARASGNADEARHWLQQSLTLEPGNARTRAVLRELERDRPT